MLLSCRPWLLLLLVTLAGLGAGCSSSRPAYQFAPTALAAAPVADEPAETSRPAAAAAPTEALNQPLAPNLPARRRSYHPAPSARPLPMAAARAPLSVLRTAASRVVPWPPAKAANSDNTITILSLGLQLTGLVLSLVGLATAPVSTTLASLGVLLLLAGTIGLFASGSL
jgi:hypothetical protein